MKLLSLLFLLTIILSCKNPEYKKVSLPNIPTLSWDEENLNKFNKHYLCKNQLYLITNTNNNFKFNIDSIRNGNSYFRLMHKRIKESNPDYSSTDVTFDVIPYTEINNITVSLGKSLIKPKGSGYFSHHSEQFLYINFREKSIYWKTNNYFSNFLKIYTNSPTESIPPPFVSLNMTDTVFAPVKPALINIYYGYLQAMEKHSMNYFYERVCNLELQQLDSLKKWFPLRIRVTKGYKNSIFQN